MNVILLWFYHESVADEFWLNQISDYRCVCCHKRDPRWPFSLIKHSIESPNPECDNIPMSKHIFPPPWNKSGDGPRFESHSCSVCWTFVKYLFFLPIPEYPILCLTIPKILNKIEIYAFIRMNEWANEMPRVHGNINNFRCIEIVHLSLSYKNISYVCLYILSFALCAHHVHIISFD